MALVYGPKLESMRLDLLDRFVILRNGGAFGRGMPHTLSFKLHCNGPMKASLLQGRLPHANNHLSKDMPVSVPVFAFDDVV